MIGFYIYKMNFTCIVSVNEDPDFRNEYYSLGLEKQWEMKKINWKITWIYDKTAFKLTDDGLSFLAAESAGIWGLLLPSISYSLY